MTGMLATVLKGIAGHRRRFLASCTAVLLGVTFLTGTLVLGDTVERSFADMFTEANQGTAVIVRSSGTVGSSGAAQRGVVDADTVARVAGVEGVGSAAAVVQGPTQIVGADGTPLGGDGPPTIGSTWIADPSLNPYRLVEGRAPTAAAPGAPVEVVIDRAAARRGGLSVGSRTTVQTPEPVAVEVVGIAGFCDQESMAGTTFTGFSAPDAARLLVGGRDVASAVRLAAAPGTSDAALADSVRSVLPPGTEALTGRQLAAEELQTVRDDFLGLMETMLTVFAGIALLVATFSIHNTFAILAAQRSRESALLRSLGATRAQVLGGALLEALTVAVVAVAAGLAAGVGLAALLERLLTGSDVGLPTGPLAIGAGSLVAGALVGFVVTIVAAVSPALQSSRVSPLDALRTSAAEPARLSRPRLVVGGLGLGGGAALLVSGTTGDGSLGRVGLGAVTLVVGFLLVAPLLARGAALALGLPGRLLRGVTGQLAQENARRNPRRTAGTATALVIGMGVVTLFTIFGASLKASIEHEVTASFGATDLVIEARSFGGSGIGRSFSEQVASVDGVAAVAPLAFTGVEVDGRSEMATVTDPAALEQVSDLGVVGGSLAGLDDHQVAVSKAYAKDHGLQVGTGVTAGFADGSVPVTVGAIYEAKGALGDVIVPEQVWAPHATRALGDRVVLVGFDRGADAPAVTRKVDTLAEGFGSPTVRDRQQYLDAVGGQVQQMLTIVYVLLGVAVVIALLGIANTLSLSIHERTRELGVLRAVGQTRRQLRSAIRWEAVVVAVFGTLAGLALGAVIAWAVVGATSSTLALTTFALPTSQLAIVVVVGAAVGVLAAVRPARRAARLDVLTALASD